MCALTTKIDYPNKTITMTAPRSCIGHVGKLRIRDEIDDAYQNLEGSDCCDDDTFDELPSILGWTEYVRSG